MLTRRNPNYSTLIFDNLDQVMDDFFGEGSLNHFASDKWFTFNNDSNIARHPIHASSDASGVTIDFDVPGSNKEDLEIVYDDHTKKLLVSSKVEKRNTNGLEVRSFSYSYWLGEKYDPNTIEAKCDKGVLTITAQLHKPKVEEKKKRTIEIK